MATIDGELTPSLEALRQLSVDLAHVRLEIQDQDLANVRWLIGLNRVGFDRCGAALMSGIAWGSDQVLGSTLAAAANLQLPVALLREQSDLDRRAALEPWLLRAKGSR